MTFCNPAFVELTVPARDAISQRLARRVRRADLDVQVLEHQINIIRHVGGAGIRGHAMMPAFAVADRESADTGGECNAGEQRGNRRAPGQLMAECVCGGAKSCSSVPDSSMRSNPGCLPILCGFIYCR